MELSFEKVVTVSGHSGLFKVVRPTHHGLLVETLDAQKARSVKNMNSHKVSSLSDISIYTTGEEDTVPLSDILQQLYAMFTGVVPEDQYDSPEKLQTVLNSVMPDYDRDRVYVSNIKKIVHWYNILVQHLPELLQPEASSQGEQAPEEDVAH